jgi:hypothetical protein
MTMRWWAVAGSILAQRVVIARLRHGDSQRVALTPQFRRCIQAERLPALSWRGLRHTMSLTAAWAEHAFSGWAASTCAS